MHTLVSAYQDKSLDFQSLRKETAEFFLVKNRQSEAVVLCDIFSKLAGYANPIDYLGRLDYDLQCPAVEMADLFMSQDRKVIQNKDRRLYMTITAFADKYLQIYFTTKEHYLGHMVCNVWIVNQGLFFKYFQKLLFNFGELFNTKVHRCFEIIDTFSGLTVRESEVLFFMLQQQNSTHIADILCLSKRTVQHHIESIKLKMNCHSTQHVIQLALYLSLSDFIPRSLLGFKV